MIGAPFSLGTLLAAMQRRALCLAGVQKLSAHRHMRTIEDVQMLAVWAKTLVKHYCYTVQVYSEMKSYALSRNSV